MVSGGWYKEPYRHSLAARGIPSSRYYAKRGGQLKKRAEIAGIPRFRLLRGRGGKRLTKVVGGPEQSPPLVPRKLFRGMDQREIIRTIRTQFLRRKGILGDRDALQAKVFSLKDAIATVKTPEKLQQQEALKIELRELKAEDADQADIDEVQDKLNKLNASMIVSDLEDDLKETNASLREANKEIRTTVSGGLAALQPLSSYTTTQKEDAIIGLKGLEDATDQTSGLVDESKLSPKTQERLSDFRDLQVKMKGASGDALALLRAEEQKKFGKLAVTIPNMEDARFKRFADAAPKTIKRPGAPSGSSVLGDRSDVKKQIDKIKKREEAEAKILPKFAPQKGPFQPAEIDPKPLIKEKLEEKRKQEFERIERREEIAEREADLVEKGLKRDLTAQEDRELEFVRTNLKSPTPSPKAQKEVRRKNELGGEMDVVVPFQQGDPEFELDE